MRIHLVVDPNSKGSAVKLKLNLQRHFTNVECFIYCGLQGTGAFDVRNGETGVVYFSKVRQIYCSDGLETQPPDSNEQSFRELVARLEEDGAVRAKNPPPVIYSRAAFSGCAVT